MASVFCTKKLIDFVGKSTNMISVDLDNLSINDWNAHLFFIDKRKCLIFVHNLTFYTVFITDIQKKDLEKIDSIFRQRLTEQIIHDKIIDNLESLKNVFPDLTLNFYKTNNNRKVIGRINDFLATFKFHRFYRYESLTEMNVVYENGLINETPTGKFYETKKGWSSPNENLKEIIKTGA